MNAEGLITIKRAERAFFRIPHSEFRIRLVLDSLESIMKGHGILRGIAWRPADLPDVPGASPATWCVFFEPALAGRMTLLEHPRDVLGAMLRLRGHSVNAIDAALLQQARDDALASRGFLAGFRAPDAVPVLGEGIVVSQARSGEAGRAVAADPGIAFARDPERKAGPPSRGIPNICCAV